LKKKMAESDDNNDDTLVLRPTTTPMDVLRWAAALTREGHTCHSFGQDGTRELNCCFVPSDSETPPVIAEDLQIHFKGGNERSLCCILLMRPKSGMEKHGKLLKISSTGPLIEPFTTRAVPWLEIELSTPNKLTDFLESHCGKVWIEAFNDPSTHFEVTTHHEFGSKIVPVSMGKTVKSAKKE
jgi:hypothetical protein